MEAAAWAVVGVLLLVVEMFTLTVIVGMVGVGALAAALAAVLGAPVLVQGGVFAATSIGLVAFAREPVQRALAGKTDHDGNLDATSLTGQRATVVEAVTDGSGQVRLFGELWRARPYAGTGPVDVGRTVSVAAVEGATLLVFTPELD